MAQKRILKQTQSSIAISAERMYSFRGQTRAAASSLAGAVVRMGEEEYEAMKNNYYGFRVRGSSSSSHSGVNLWRKKFVLI